MAMQRLVLEKRLVGSPARALIRAETMGSRFLSARVGSCIDRLGSCE
jgi:hypothetical protein